MEFVGQIVANATDNILWILVWGLFALLLVPLVWWRAPALIQPFLRWLDSVVPGDFSSLHRPLSRWIAGVLSLAILGLAAIAVAGALRGEVASTGVTLLGLAASAGQWVLVTGAKILVILGLAFLVHRAASRAIPEGIERYVRSRAGEGPESEVQKDIRTLSTVITGGVTLVIFVAALFMVLAQLGFNLAPLLAAAGVVGIAVGFGAQTMIRDILAGFFIILEKQYRVGDVVNIAGTGGLVEEINLRRTVLRDLDYTQHFVPNGEVRVASNLTKIKSRVNLNIPVAYKEDLDRVIGVLNEIGQEMARDPVWAPLILDPPKVLRVDGFADSAVEIKVLGETLPIRQWDVMGEYRLRVKRTFDRLGIEIPYPHRTLFWGAGQAPSAAAPEGTPLARRLGPNLEPPEDGPEA